MPEIEVIDCPEVLRSEDGHLVDRPENTDIGCGLFIYMDDESDVDEMMDSIYLAARRKNPNVTKLYRYKVELGPNTDKRWTKGFYFGISEGVK